MLRSFAVYTIPVIVFALAWNIPRFGEPIYFFLLLSFDGISKLIIPKPVQLFTFYSGELSTCYVAVNKSREWRAGDIVFTDIAPKTSSQTLSQTLQPSKARRLRQK